MQVKFWGTRGSLPKPGPTTERYGGNTSCVEVRSSTGTLIVLDCGTGGHALGQHLVAEAGGAVDGHLLISHTHWDHIQGVPFFAPLFIPGGTWRIYGPGGLSQSLHATLAGQMEHTYFPITLDQFAATVQYHDLVEGAFSIGDVHVTARYLNHPALTLGYRLEVDGVSVVYCCDHEPHSVDMANGEVTLTGMDRRYADFVANADLVIHDTQYTAGEYPEKVGWGHSPVEYAVRVCQDAGVRKLALTHYDPLRNDDAVDQILDQVWLRLRDIGSPLEVVAAAEGMVLDLSGHPRSQVAASKKQFDAEAALDLVALKRPVYMRVADAGLSRLLREAVEAEGLICRIAADDAELVNDLANDSPGLILIEHSPPLQDGLATARAVRECKTQNKTQVPLVLIRSAGQLKAGGDDPATDWLVKPFSLSYARSRIRAWVLRAACRWTRAHMPLDEVDRIKALRNLAVLDTPAEERFDRLTRIAATALDMPITLVSLIDSDRQWFKSCFGLDVRETSREVAFCAHVVYEKKEMIVRDTLLDDRFADNPLVVDGPRIRSYIGMPLTLQDGSCIGTFCAIDVRPRDLTDRELNVLRDLRDLALAELQSA